jgi:VanZ family protein
MRSFQIILLRLPALLIAGVIWFLSSQSILPQPKGILGWDKLQHFLAYGALGVAAGLWASPVFWKRRHALALLLTTLAGSAYGAIDEFHQYFVPGRDCNVWDWIADTLGAFLGALAIMLYIRFFKSGANNNLKASFLLAVPVPGCIRLHALSPNRYSPFMTSR